MATTQKAAAAAVKSIKGTRTEQAIVNAYISESQAYTRYIYYAQQAQKENLFPIQQVFEETAANELHHGKVFMKMLEGGVVNCNVGVDAVKIQDTASNLRISINEEHYEAMDQYFADAKVAEEEGFPISPPISAPSQRWKSTIWSVSRAISSVLKMVRSGSEKNRFPGSVWYAVISS